MCRFCQCTSRYVPCECFWCRQAYWLRSPLFVLWWTTVSCRCCLFLHNVIKTSLCSLQLRIYAPNVDVKMSTLSFFSIIQVPSICKKLKIKTFMVTIQYSPLAAVYSATNNSMLLFILWMQLFLPLTYKTNIQKHRCINSRKETKFYPTAAINCYWTIFEIKFQFGSKVQAVLLLQPFRFFHSHLCFLVHTQQWGWGRNWQRWRLILQLTNHITVYNTKNQSQYWFQIKKSKELITYSITNQAPNTTDQTIF